MSGKTRNQRCGVGDLAKTARVIFTAIATIIAPIATALLPAANLHAQGADRVFGYVYTVGPDTIGVERLTVGDGQWTGDVVLRNQGRTIWSALVGQRGRFGQLDLRAFRTAQDTAPSQVATLSLTGDTVRMTRISPQGAGAAIASKTDAFMLVNASVGMIELMVARVDRNSTGAFPVFLSAGGATIDATVKRTGDSATVNIAGQATLVSLDAEGRMLSGYTAAQNLRFVRVEGEELARISIGAPNYDAPADAPYTAEHGLISAMGGHRLAATLTRPRSGATRFPAVVTISGSGAQDRDEWIPVANGYRPFRQFADTLGRNGIAVVRFDDRGYGASTGNHSRATSADFADDVRSVVAWLRTRADIDPDRIFLLGHSEGAMIAPMVAANDPNLAGLVLLAGPSQNGRDIIFYQQRYVIDRDTSLRTAAARDSVAAVARTQFDSLAKSQPWLGFFATYDPLATARAVKVPSLILHGATDRQVTAEQADELARAMRDGGNRDVTARVFSDLNHLFLPDTDGDPANYVRMKSGHIGPDVAGLVVDWITARSKRTP